MESIAVSRTDGSTVEFTRLGTNAVCALEETLGLEFGQILDAIGVGDLRKWSLRVTRQFLQAAAPSMTVEAIGDLIDEVGFDQIATVVNRLIVPAQSR